MSAHVHDAAVAIAQRSTPGDIASTAAVELIARALLDRATEATSGVSIDSSPDADSASRNWTCRWVRATKRRPLNP